MQQTTLFDLDAGIDCLAFANTLENRADPVPIERLAGYGDLVAFAEQAGIIDITQANNMRLLAEREPDAARDVFDRARAVREAIYRVFSAVAAGRLPAAGDLDHLNAELLQAMVHAHLVVRSERVEWGWQEEPWMLDRPLWPIMRSAADLLTSEDLDRVRECSAHDCGWLFFDESRNRSRRWCSMQTCGNRAKVDRFRARRRDAVSADEDAS